MRFIFFILTTLPLYIFSEIDIRTIDAFEIKNLGLDRLIITKESDTPNSGAGLFFLMDRPYCLCEEVSFAVGNPSKENSIRPAQGSYFEGKMRVDFKRPKDISFRVKVALESEDWNIIAPKGPFPSIRNAKIVEITTPYGVDRFILEGFKDVMRQATKICESFIPYEDEGAAEAKEVSS